MTEPEEDTPEPINRLLYRNEANILVTYDLLEAKINVATSQGGLEEAENTVKKLLRQVSKAQTKLRQESVSEIMSEQLKGSKFDVSDAG